MLGEDVLALDDVAPRTRDIQERLPRCQAVLLPADVAVRPVKIRRRADFRGLLAGRCSSAEADIHTLQR
jgi:hypothetical protein